MFCPWHISRFAQSSSSWELTVDGIWISRTNPRMFLVIHSWRSITKTCCFWFLPVSLHSSPCDASTWKTQRDNFMMRETRQKLNLCKWESTWARWGCLLPTAFPTSHPTAMPWVTWILASFFMVKCISLLNNSALKVRDKTEEKNTELDLHSTPCLPHPTIPHPTILWHPREVQGEQTKLQPVGAGKIFGGRTLPHTTQAQTRAGDRCCPFLRQTRVSGGRRCQSFLDSLAEKSLLCIISFWMLYPQPHPKYMVLHRHWLGQGASHIQSLAQWAPLLWGSEEQP